MKTVPIASSEMTEIANKDTGIQQKRPPPLPPPPEKYRRNRSRYVIEKQSQCDITKCEKDVNEGDQRKLSSDVTAVTIDTAKSTRSHDGTTSARETLMTDYNANDNTVSKLRSPLLSSRDIVASSERTARDGYPSLFFTLRDFEEVMSTTWNRSKPVNETSAADLGDLSISRLLARSEMLDDDDDNVSFRVTTTNLPFEKCLDEWKDCFCDGAFGNYRLNDSTSKNDPINTRKSSDSFDNELDHRVGTKVHFAIEASPTKSNRDPKINMSRDNLQSCESILGDEQSTTFSVQLLTEIHKEFAEKKDHDDSSQDKSCTLIAKEEHFTKADDLSRELKLANVISNTTSETCYYDKSNDVNYERIRREDSTSISWSECVENENLGIGEENRMTLVDETNANEKRAAKQMDQKETLAASAEIAEHTRRFIDESTGTTCKYEEANAAEISEKGSHQEKEIFSTKSDKNDIKEDRATDSEMVLIGESVESFLNDDASRDNSTGESCKRIFIDDPAHKLLNLFDSQRSSTEESRTNERITSDFADSRNNCGKSTPSEEIFTKSVPVKIRRDSFLETMLSEDATDVSVECAIIPIQTVMSSLSVNKELSIQSESANKVQELDTDSARERESSYGIDNAIKADTENQNVLKDAKKARERTAGMPSTDANSTQSENKSAGDAKNDVLNELLCNFSNIKLKIVSPENKKPETRIGDEQTIIAHPVMIDNRISIEDTTASFNPHTLEKCRDEARDIVEAKLELSIETIDGNDDPARKIMKDLAKFDSVIDEKIVNNVTTKLGEASIDVKNNTKGSPSKSKVGEKDIKSKEIRTRPRINETAKSTENKVNEAKQETKKSRDSCTPKTILKKKSVECEQANQFQKRIPIGAPATMNKIFDSRELEMIANASHRSSLEKRLVLNGAHGRVGGKTDKETIDKDDPRRIASQPALLRAENMSSDDKCAIARKTTSVIPYNNDNNRAVTAVANVSNDQSSRDVVTITPGKVRSFVKYYEIRGDVTTVERHSKINDREKVAKRKSTKNRAASIATRSPLRSEIKTERKETTDGSRSVRSNDAPETSFSKTRLCSRMPEDSPDNSIREKSGTESRLTGKRERSGSHVPDKAHVPLAKTSMKKSVQFRGGFTVIRSETFDEDEEFAGITVDHDASRKKKAPGIPLSRDSEEHIREIAKLEKLSDARKDFLPRRETVAQIRAVATYGEKAGINRFVTKPETPQLVFYCTV